MSKKRRLAEGFSPDAIAGRLAEKTRIQEEMEDIVLKLQRSDCSYILKNNTIQYNTLQETVTFTDKKKIAYNYSDPGGTLEKLSHLKPLFSHNEELYISKEVKEKMLLHQRINHADQKQ